jgi:hypothetical protein
LSAKIASKSSTFTSARCWTVRAGVVDEDLKRRCFGGYGAARRFDVGHVEHQRLGRPAARANGTGRLFNFRLRARASVTCAPACASAEAAASPIPRPPPVTSARRPSRRKEGVLARSIECALLMRFLAPFVHPVCGIESVCAVMALCAPAMLRAPGRFTIAS